ncbi:shikimate dehydrogenase family protein [Salipiger mangrovisoli]|uniref:shikimate dehydrogenase (NADP(+)) n=1 Tax=Salipiger mangrovisoli TaxID=2865933 RepID=A0ABR9X5L8_9RHOB|nr:shikimate dehydrogenase [Salipiger mangrovisoli]MBE9638832.1 shikimate dehydrogenase [Salipiger mangrovisoli]
MHTTAITGRTGLYVIIADPIHHVKTPQVVNRTFVERRIDGVLVPLHVPPGRLAQAMDGLRAIENLKGFVVTVPHKTAAVTLCDRLTPDAELIGAVNCIRRETDGQLVGAMLDGIGFVEGFLGAGHVLKEKEVCLLGAGGAAKAIAFAVAAQGPARLSIFNRSATNAEDLARRVRARFPTLDIRTGTPDVAEGEVLINATALGMHAGDPLPLPVERLRPEMTIAEIIMDPAETALMAAARQAGARVHPGLPMLEAQAVLMARHMGAPGV